MVAMSIKLVCAAIQALLISLSVSPPLMWAGAMQALPERSLLSLKSLKKSRATRVRLFRLQFFRQKLLLHAALLAALAHALKADGAVNQSKQGIIAALANVLTRLNVGATLTNKDVAGQNELTICTLCAQTLSRRITAVLGAAYALLCAIVIFLLSR